MKVRCEWLVLCERVLKDEASNNLTLVDCVEDIPALVFPALHHRFAFAARYVRLVDGPDIDVSFRFARVDPDGSESELVQVDGTWRAEASRLRVYQNFDRLQLPRAGQATFRLDHRFAGEDTWTPGPIATVDVRAPDLTGEQKRKLRSQLEALELEVPEALK